MGAFVDKTLETFELMAVAITELRQRVEALEARALENKDPEYDGSPDYQPGYLAEKDSSHVISVGESHYHL